MKVVYVAGPFRGANSWEIENNIRRAETLALEVWRLGAAAICPHANTRFFQGAAPDGLWLKGDLEILRRCDAILMTRDWDRSEGARVEREEAIRLKLPVFYENAREGLQPFAEWIHIEKASEQWALNVEAHRANALAEQEYFRTHPDACMRHGNSPGC